ncbi:glycoside hydrolase family 18 protein [Atractiella rhizophila]|nr:glycoside hydrolase family 18 protein [Atractiella rhizophila]
MRFLSSLLSLATLAAAVPASVELLKRVDTTVKRNIVFVQTFHDTSGNPLSLLPLLNEGTGITHIILASVHLNDDPHDIHLNDNPPSDPMFDQTWREVKQLQAAGIKVMALLGGWGDGSWGHLNSDFDAYYRPLVDEFIKPFGLDGLDLDIESPQSVDLPLRILTSLYNDMGPNFILTLAPVASALASETGGDLSGFSYFELDQRAVVPGTTTKLVSWYNAQFYSGFGNPSTPAYYRSIINAGWDPLRVVLGVLVNPNDGNGWYPLAVYQSTVTQLVTQYSNFGGVFGWEYWDAGARDGLQYPWQWVKAIGQSLGRATARMIRSLLSMVVRDVPVTPFANLPYPAAPFPNSSFSELTSKGATHYEALRALNLTEGNVPAAEEILKEQIGDAFRIAT